MVERIVRHLRANFVAYLALFFALGGTSLAAVQALPRNSVGSPQIRNRSVQTIDLSRRAVTALRGRRGLRGLQGPQGPKGENGEAGAPGPVGPTFGRASSNGAACDLTVTAYSICASTGEISLPTAGRVLLVAAAQWYGSAPPNKASCQFFVDRIVLSGRYAFEFGEYTLTHPSSYPGIVSFTDVTEPLPAGAHTFTLECRELEAELTLHVSTISAVLLGGG